MTAFALAAERRTSGGSRNSTMTGTSPLLSATGSIGALTPGHCANSAETQKGSSTASRRIGPPGEADRAADQIGVASGKIRGVIRAKARPVDREVAALRAIERVRNHLVAKIRIVLRMARRADGGVDMAVVPALAVNRIDAKELDLA